MATLRIQLIHAVDEAREPIRAAFARHWPEARTVELTDTSLAADLEKAGRLTDAFTDRMSALIRYGVACGADGVLFTCSAFGPSIERARRDAPVPVFKPDEAMIDEALDHGHRITALATFEPTLGSLRGELDRAARARGATLSVVLRHVPGALQALRDGRGSDHDALIVAATRTAEDSDVLMLAQFSMARAAEGIASVPGRRVLTSPDAAVRKLRSALEQRTRPTSFGSISDPATPQA